MKKLVLIGLDCADPRLVFEEFLPYMPNLRKILRVGQYGRLESTIPPITVPAWMSMMTGKDPGTLGIYGFRNRKDYSYNSIAFVSSHSVKHEPVWKTLGKKGLRSIVLGVPPTYPPQPINGYLVSGFLTPSTQSEYTYPPHLKKEIQEWVGEYLLDVEDFRTSNKERLLRDIYRVTGIHFEVARQLLTRKEWDFFMMVEMGPDRMHHGFWAFYDVTHPKHDPENPLKSAMREYYTYLDSEIGKLLEVLPEGVEVIIASDHGAQKMDGGIAINDWLITKGYLVLKKQPSQPTRIGELIAQGLVDWSKTKAWGMGGYYGRLFLNVKGREPEGVIPPEDYEAFREHIASELAALTDEEGRNIGTVVFKPEEIYEEANGIPPDLIIYFGNLTWRSIGTVGNESIWVHENDTGPDDANHAQFGLIVSSLKDRIPEKIYDVRDLILRFFS